MKRVVIKKAAFQQLAEEMSKRIGPIIYSEQEAKQKRKCSLQEITKLAQEVKATFTDEDLKRLSL